MVAGFIQVLPEIRQAVGFTHAYSLHLTSYPVMITDGRLIVFLIMNFGSDIGDQHITVVPPMHFM